MIINIAACCGNCTYWIQNEHENEKDYGSCLKAPSCFCCHRDQLFGGTGGGDFESHRSFMCKFWSTEKELVNCRVCNGTGLLDYKLKWNEGGCNLENKCYECDGTGKVVKIG